MHMSRQPLLIRQVNVNPGVSRLCVSLASAASHYGNSI